jgi:hypothetical protein
LWISGRLPQARSSPVNPTFRPIINRLARKVNPRLVFVAFDKKIVFAPNKTS